MVQKIKNFTKKNWFLFLVIAYIVSPVDIIPDYIPVVGMADDLLLIIVQFINMLVEYKRDQRLNNMETIVKVSKEHKKNQVVDGEIEK